MNRLTMTNLLKPTKWYVGGISHASLAENERDKGN